MTFLQISNPTPERLRQGHVIFASIAASHPSELGVIVPPEGWTRIEENLTLSTDTPLQLATFYKIAGPREPLTYDFKYSPRPGNGGEPRAFMSATAVFSLRQGGLDRARSAVGPTTPALESSGNMRVTVAVFARDRAGNYTPPAGWSRQSSVKGGSAERGHTQYVIGRVVVDAAEVAPVTVINDTPAQATLSQVIAFKR